MPNHSSPCSSSGQAVYPHCLGGVWPSFTYTTFMLKKLVWFVIGFDYRQYFFNFIFVIYHYLRLTSVFHACTVWTVNAYEIPPPNSIHRPFSMQTQFNNVLLHTLIPILPTLAPISYYFNTATCWKQIITILRFTWPNHCSLLLLTTCAMHSTLFKWTPHLTIIRSVLSNLAVSSTFIAKVSLAYPKTLWIQPLHTFSFTLKALLDVSTEASSLNFAKPQRTLAYSCSWCFFCTNQGSQITKLFYAFQLINWTIIVSFTATTSQNNCPSIHLLHWKSASTFCSLPTHHYTFHESKDGIDCT